MNQKDFIEAARLAQQQGRMSEAAGHYQRAGRPFEAGQCYLRAKDPEKGLERLIHVPLDDERYREACLLAVKAAATLGAFDYQTDQFLVDFFRSGPQSEQELGAFYLLGILYQQHDFPAKAKEAWGKLLQVKPDYRDARERLSQLASAEAKPPETSNMIALEELKLGQRAGGRAKRRPDAQSGAATVAATMGAASTLYAAQQTGTASTMYAQPAAKEPSGGDGPAFYVGARIGERYILEEKLGAGSMGVVFRAKDLELAEDVALKVFMLPVDDEALLARFKMEIKITRQLVHPNIIRVYDMGFHQRQRYIIMEYLHGCGLNQKIAQGGIDFATAMSYLIQAFSGLQAAHERGVVHRDVKPENCFVTEEGVLKVMDFGIAKQQSASGLTVAGMIAGTPAYMSPEQINNFGAVTPATDLYALGVIAYQIFTGQVPFEHPDLMPLLQMHLTKTPDPPRRYNPAIPEELEALILSLLEKDPANRPASCKEAIEILIAVRDRYA